MKLSPLLLLATLAAVPAYAGQAVIVETDHGYVVEYAPSEADHKEAQAEQQEQDRVEAREAREREVKRASAQRRLALRGEDPGAEGDSGAPAEPQPEAAAEPAPEPAAEPASSPDPLTPP